ncbi:MAG TPA: PD-(D/E)XK nuclease family protein [Bryobacteraceae bacterium]|nr:PD-(D/E)XK nuclease family protein [Bryobacteraceae bacterium]
MNGRVVTCSSCSGFPAEIAAFLEQHRGSEALMIGASRGTADDLLRDAAPGGIVGAHRFTLAQAAAVLSAPALAHRGLKIADHFTSEALAARVVHELRLRKSWKYFGPVAATPGFAQALARTLTELRLNEVSGEKVRNSGTPGADLSAALALYTELLARGGIADVADLFVTAVEACVPPNRLIGLPIVFLDVELGSVLARRFASALARLSPAVLACTLSADKDGTGFFENLFGAAATCIHQNSANADTLQRVWAGLFVASARARHELDDTLDYFSAPGEAMECVEIARRIVKLGLPFDRVAVLLRSPERYQPLLQEALRRAGIPAHFTRGVVRPDPAGRAFLALLECALENCSASRFAEYLSLAQVPSPGQPSPHATASDDEIHSALRGEVDRPEEIQEPEDDDSDPVIAGTLQAPAQWEHLLIDAAVIGGADRWERRLKALENELRLRLAGSEDPAHYQRELQRLDNLKAFALPLIQRLANLPKLAPWGTWLERLTELARVSLRRPSSVLAVLEELEPMADVGPVGLAEVALVLSDRLRFLRREPPLRRGGHVFVGAIDEARGRSFDAVFVPGLAEGVFPRKVAEDPLLLDAYRAKVSDTLHTNKQRRERERLLLRIAVGAAAKQFTFSWPRVDMAESRPRVPSFYALEVIRAANGYLPELRSFQEEAAARAPSRLDRLAPVAYADAIDNAEYDLVALDRAVPKQGKPQLGAMAYLTHVSEPLGRSLRARYSRWEIRSKWTACDGLVNADADLGPSLQAYRLAERPYSPTALQAFASCPYRFALLGMHGLRPRDTIQPMNQMDPLTRGALFHAAQREFFERAVERELLPVTAANLPACRDVLDASLKQTEEQYREQLAPAIARVWNAEIEDMRTDLQGWLQHIAGESDWRPEHFELAFGLRERSERDALSNAEPVVLDRGVKLRGAIDLVERHATRGTLRIVDHKTGKPPERRSPQVGGGTSLQPLLYALAAEKRLGGPVDSGRLFYCTNKGNYQIVDVPLTADTRLRVGRVLEIIDHAIATGNLPAAPNPKACDTCDCRCVCGPHEERRWRLKTVEFEELQELRNMP